MGGLEDKPFLLGFWPLFISVAFAVSFREGIFLMLRFSGSHGSIVVPHGPSAVGDLQSQIREGFLTAAGQCHGLDGGWSTYP